MRCDAGAGRSGAARRGAWRREALRCVVRRCAAERCVAGRGVAAWCVKRCAAWREAQRCVVRRCVAGRCGVWRSDALRRGAGHSGELRGADHCLFFLVNEIAHSTAVNAGKSFDVPRETFSILLRVAFESASRANSA
jgi:hypothetical protein